MQNSLAVSDFVSRILCRKQRHAVEDKMTTQPLHDIYATKSDDELQQLVLEADELEPMAKELLLLEVSKRHLQASEPEAEAPPQPSKAYTRMGSLVLVGLGILALAYVAALVPKLRLPVGLVAVYAVISWVRASFLK